MRNLGWLSLMLSALVACDGSGLEPGQVQRAPDTAIVPDTTEPAETTPAEETTPTPALEVTDPLEPAEPVAPTVTPLPSGTSDGSGLIGFYAQVFIGRNLMA